MKIQIKKQIDQALEALTPQQREVIVYRYGLNGKRIQTLQEIADDYELTRERIRQIQSTALKQLRNDPCVRHLSSAFSHMEEALHACGGVADHETLCLVCGLATKAEQGYVRLLLDIGEHFLESAETDSMRKYWYINANEKKQAEQTVGRIHDYFEKNSDRVLSDGEMRSVFSKTGGKLGERPDAMRIMRLSKKVASNKRGEWGVSRHPEITLSHIAGYIRVVLRDSDEPLHFRVIAERIGNMRGEPCHQGSCHNELVRNSDFILVGQGLYALHDSDNFPGTIADVVENGMREHGLMNRDDIVAYVGRYRKVKPESIDMVLYREKKFRKNENGTYSLVSG